MMLENVAITVVLPRAASRCSRTRSHSHSHALARPPVGSHYLTLDRIRSHSLALSRARQNSFALARSLVGSHSLELSHFLSNSLAQCCKTSFHSLPSCYSSNESICYVATKFFENILIGIGDVTAKWNSKECSLVAEFNTLFQFLHLSVFQDFYMCHLAAKLQRNQTIRGWAIAT